MKSEKQHEGRINIEEKPLNQACIPNIAALIENSTNTNT